MKRRRFITMLAGLPLLPLALVAAPRRSLHIPKAIIVGSEPPQVLRNVVVPLDTGGDSFELPPFDVPLKPDVIIGSKERIAELRAAFEEAISKPQ